jgi:hypothetical protein
MTYTVSITFDARAIWIASFFMALVAAEIIL